MVSNSAIIAFAVATLIYGFLIVYGFVKLRKTEHFWKNFGMGIAIYFVTNMILSLLIQVTGFNNPIFNTVLGTLALIVSLVLILSIVSRQEVDSTINTLGLTFGFAGLTLFQGITVHFSNFMASFAVNKGELAVVYPDLSTAEIQEITTRFASYNGLDIVASVIAFLVSMFGIILAIQSLTSYVKDKTNTIKLIEAIVILALINIIPAALMALLSNSSTVSIIYYILLAVVLLNRNKLKK